MNASDRAVRDRLTALGLTVTVADDNGITAAAATGKQLIVISSTVDPLAVNATFAATAVPLVTWEHMLYDDLGLTADTGAHGVSAGEDRRSRSPVPAPRTRSEPASPRAP